jgi:hypothetical protein
VVALSAAHYVTVVPSHRTDWGTRSFAVAGPGMFCLLIRRDLRLLAWILLQNT